MSRTYRRIYLQIMKFVKLITFQNRSIQYKIILNYLFVIIPILIIGNSYYVKESSVIKDNFSKSMSQINIQLNDKIDGILTNAENFTLMIQYIKAVRNTFFDNKSILDIKTYEKINSSNAIIKGTFEDREGSLFYLNDTFSSIEVYSVRGKFLYGRSKDSTLDNLKAQSQKWFKRIIDLKGYSYSVSSFKPMGSLYDSYYFSSARAIVDDKTMKVLGVAIINMNENVLDRLISNIDFGDKGRIIVVDEEDNVIYSKDKDEIAEKLQDRILAGLPKSGSMRTRINNSYSLINYNTSTHTGWKVISIVQDSYISKQLVSVKNFTIIIIIICITVGLVVTVLISYKITYPLKQLTKTLENSKNGQLPKRVFVGNKDEIGQLARSFNRMIKRIDILIKSIYIAQIREKQTKLDALQIQINPHFLYNTLETIRMLAEINDDLDVIKISEMLGKLLRYGISNYSEKVPLRDEIEHLKNYIFIQNYRFDGKFDMDFGISVELLDVYVIKLIIQPVVENSIYHALEGMRGKSLISISGYMFEGDMLIEVKDNGKGMDENSLEILKRRMAGVEMTTESHNMKKSIGLSNVNERIKLCYGEQYGLEIYSKLNEGTRVIIRLPKATT